MYRVVLLSLVIAGLASAQIRGAAEIERLLQRAGVPTAPAPPPRMAASSQEVRQLHLSWNTSAPPPRNAATADAIHALSVLSDRTFGSGLRKQRMPELGRDTLLVAGLDAQDRAVYWEIISDPRIVRAELPAASGELKGTVLRQENPDFLFAFPSGASVARVRVYEPRWTAPEASLELVAEMPVSRSR